MWIGDPEMDFFQNLFPEDCTMFGEWLIKRQIELGVSGREFANMLDISQSSYSMYVRGVRFPTRKKLSMMLYNLGSYTGYVYNLDTVYDMVLYDKQDAI